MSKYGLGGCDLPNKRVNCGPSWSQSQAGLRKTDYEVGLGQGQALGLDCSSSTSTTIGQTIYIQ